MERMEKMHTSIFRAAVVGDISCGLPNIAEENIEEYVSLLESMFGRGEFYILRARGESMIEAEIETGNPGAEYCGRRADRRGTGG